MPILPPNCSLRALQEYVSKIEKERGFSDESVIQKCLLLGEEVGELFKAVRKGSGIKVDPKSQVNSIEDELADIFVYTLAIANRYNIDLYAALTQKEERNSQRVWR